MTLATLNPAGWIVLMNRSRALLSSAMAIPAGVSNFSRVEQRPLASFFDRSALIRR